MLNDALRLHKSGKYSEAIHLYNKILSRNARLQTVYFDRGLAYREQKRYGEALNDFNKIIELKGPGPVIVEINENFRDNSEESRSEIPYSDALYQRAQTKYLMDSLQSSFWDFQYLIDNNYEERSNCLLWQGDIYIRSGKKEKGCSMFQRAREVAKNNYDIEEANRMITANCNSK
jgi:tetratricopeptide (TPR) repeat protein